MEEENNSSTELNRRGSCQKGFFVLRKCDKPAIAKCALSRRYICEDCAMEYEGKVVSREAYVREMDRLNKPRPKVKDEIRRWQSNDDVDYGLWYYYLRDDFYSRSNYEPFTDFDSGGFNDSEFGGGEFGGAGASGAWDDDSGKGGFYDS